MQDRLRSWTDWMRTTVNQHPGCVVDLASLIVGSLISLISLVIGLGQLFDVAIVFQYARNAFSIACVVLAMVVGLALVSFGLSRLKAEPKILLNRRTAARLQNWSPNEHWMSHEGALSVTGSMFGGICKIGQRWEDYEFSFEFKIINKFAGWIVRAESCDHHIMIQCDESHMCPHKRMTFRQADGPQYQLIQEIPLRYSLSEWNKARTEVIGHSVKVWIEGHLVWLDSALLKQFEFGTVGFRCADNEHALFRNVQVVKKQSQKTPH